jgi:hypothetical protein
VGEVTPPLHSLSREALPSLGNIFCRHMRVAVGACLSKWTQTETEQLTSSPPQPRLMQVSPDSQTSNVVPVLMRLTHLFRIVQVPSCLPIAEGATTMMVGPSSSSSGETEPPPKKSHLGSFLWMSSRYACGVTYCLCSSYFSRLVP